MANFPLTDTLIGFTRTLYLYTSRVALLEQINVLRHHKSSLFLLNTEISLNEYSFFEKLHDELLPMQLQTRDQPSH